MPLESSGRRESRIVVQDFLNGAENAKPRRTDTQLSQCLEGFEREGKELNVGGRLYHFYEENDFNAT